MKTTKKGLVLTLCAVVVMALTASAVQADIFTWNFAVGPDPGVAVGTSKPYSSTPPPVAVQKLTASGFWDSNTAGPAPGVPNWTLVGVTPTPMFEKFTTGDPGETGLGLVSSVLPGGGLGANEIQQATLIQLDLTSLKAAGFTDLTLKIGSVQGGSPDEAFAIYGSNSAAANGVTGTLLPGGTGDGNNGQGVIQTRTFSGPIPNNFIWVTATNVDVLLDNGLTVTGPGGNVPEPTSLILLGSGLLGLWGARRKFKK